MIMYTVLGILAAIAVAALLTLFLFSIPYGMLRTKSCEY